MAEKCRKCHRVLSCEEELYNSHLEQYPICDYCLDEERSIFASKGRGDDPETAEEE